jgi:predicted AlkP superfamily pyrophosphatase or phosphodiesterase
MKAEYLEWYKGELTEGFARLLSEGTTYANADLNYAPSETGPGHAALGTGSYPMHTGITENSSIDPASGKDVYCVEDTSAHSVDGYGGGASPNSLMVTGLADWWKSAFPASKVIAASIKDRAAILMSGKKPDQVYWYDRKSGRMVTSDHYVAHLPAWVQTFDTSDWVSRHMPDSWTKLLPDSIYTQYGPDEMAGERRTDGSTSFPHAYRPERKKQQLPSGPYGDEMVLDFARAAIKSEKLGQRNIPDLLILSLSCTDYIGHAYGGNSHEMIDQMVRLDRELGKFISDAEDLIGSGSLLVALSADHAALPLPEYLSTVQHISARRIPVKAVIYPEIDKLDSKLQLEWHTSEPIIRSYSFLNYATASKAGIDSTTLERQVREGMQPIDGIARVFFRRDLLNPTNANMPIVGYLQRGYYPSRGKDVIILPCEYCLFTNSTTGTSHGTPYRYDTHVPLLFWGGTIAAQKVNRIVHTVDIAPTIAKYFGVPYPPTVDGSPLNEIAP